MKTQPTTNQPTQSAPLAESAPNAESNVMGYREQKVYMSAFTLHSTRVSRAWIKVVPSVIVAAITLIFVFQNLSDVKIHFLSLSGTFPLALALLAATALGVLFISLLGSLRIMQLRKIIHRKRQSEERHATRNTEPTDQEKLSTP